MNKTIEGIILAVKDYREYDVILQVLTKEHGIQSFVAKGIRKISSKNAAVCQRFVQALFYVDYKEEQSIHSMRTADKIQMFRHIREDLVKQSIATVLSDMMLSFYNDGEYELYDDVILTFQHIDKSLKPYAAASLLLANLLDVQGMKPAVDGCVQCGDTQKICSFSAKEGGFICTKCCSIHIKKENLENLKSFRLLVLCDQEHYDILETYTNWNFYHFDMLYQFFETHSGIQLKSMKFLRNIEHMN